LCARRDRRGDQTSGEDESEDSWVHQEPAWCKDETWLSQVSSV